MSEKEFELYLSLLSRFLRLKSAQRGEIADELRDHLEARLEELSRTGLSREDAIHAALEEFGDATELAQHFTQIAARRKRRFIMRCTVGTIAVLTAGILLTTAFWPANQGMQLPPAAVAQQDQNKPADSKKEDEKKSELEPEKATKKEHPQPAPKKPAIVATKKLRTAAPGDAITPPRDERFRDVEEKLRTRITVNFPDVPLQESIEYIAQLTNVDILIDKKTILEAGGDPEEIINWNLDNYTLETVLDVILEPLRLSYHIADGIVFIETVEKALDRKEVHIYNCRDLLQGVEERIEAAQNGGGGGGGFGGGGFFQIGDGVAAEKPKSPAKPSQQPNAPVTVKLSPEQSLIRVLVHSTTGPWEEYQGAGGEITAFDGLLVVRNNQRAQHDVQMVLDMLRAADKQIPARRTKGDSHGALDPRTREPAQKHDDARMRAPADVPPFDEQPTKVPQVKQPELPELPNEGPDRPDVPPSFKKAS